MVYLASFKGRGMDTVCVKAWIEESPDTKKQSELRKQLAVKPRGCQMFS